MSTSQKAQLIALQNKIYRIELEHALDDLHKEFLMWKAGKLDVLELKEEIHKHYKGVSRDLYLKYEMASFADINVAQGIIDKLITLNEVPEDLRTMIQTRVKQLGYSNE